MASRGTYRRLRADAVVYSQREGKGYAGGSHAIANECVVSLELELKFELTQRPIGLLLAFYTGIYLSFVPGKRIWPWEATLCI